MTPTEAMPETEVNPGLDAAFESAFSSSSTAEGESVSESGAEPSSRTPDRQLDRLATPVQEERPQEQQAAEKQPQDQEVEPGVRQEGKGYRVAKERFDNLRTAELAMANISKLFPGVHDLKGLEAIRDSASDFRTMAFHYTSGRPEHLTQFLDYWDGSNAETVTEQNMLKQAFVRMAEQVPERLAKVDPQAYQRMQAKFGSLDGLQESNPKHYQEIEDRMVENALQRKYNEAIDRGDRQAFERAQWAGYVLKGAYPESMASVKRPDPMAQRAKELERQQAEIAKQRETFESQQQQGRERFWDNTRQQIENAERQTLHQLIDKQLEQASKAYNEAELAAFKRSILTEVNDELARDFILTRDRDIDLQYIESEVMDRLKAGRNIQDLKPTIDTRVSSFARIAAPLVRQHATKIVNAKTSQVVKQNGADLQRYSNSQKRSTAGGGTPTPRPVTSEKMDLDQKFAALFAGR